MSFPPTDHPAPESSNGLHEAPLSLLWSYLSKEVNTDDFKTDLACCSITSAPTDALTRVIGFISEWDTEEELRRASSPYGWMTSRCLNFTIGLTEGETIPCLHWSRSFTGVSWRVSKIQRDRTRMTCQFRISIPWLEAMVQLAIAPLIPLLRCLQFAKGERAVGIDDEILKRISAFDTTCNIFYFQSVNAFLAWEVAKHWPAWDEVNLPMEKRLAEVREAWDPALTIADFNSLLPTQILSSISTRSRFRFDGKGSTMMRSAVRSHAERMQSVFSHGGDWDEFLYRNNSAILKAMPPSGGFTRESEMEEALWWWRSIGGWPEFMQNEFRDNWARSAYLYELRARLLPTRTWDIFESSWFHLDVSQRAVLYFLWPPNYPRGKFWRQGRIYGDNQAEHDFVNTPVKNPAAMREEERVIWEEGNRMWKHDLLGQPLEHKQRSIPKKGLDWDLLEAFDQAYYFPKMYVPSDLTKRQHRAKQLHSAACEEAELPQDSPYTRI